MFPSNFQCDTAIVCYMLILYTICYLFIYPIIFCNRDTQVNTFHTLIRAHCVGVLGIAGIGSRTFTEPNSHRLELTSIQSFCGGCFSGGCLGVELRWFPDPLAQCGKPVTRFGAACPVSLYVCGKTKWID